MTNDDICGAECADGSQCQHPAGGCPVASHSDPDAENNQGRPSKFETVRDDVVEAAREGLTIEGCARAAGVHKSTLYDWLDTYDEFSDAFMRARANGERRLLKQALTDPDVDSRTARFILERSFGYTKSQEIEHSGDVDLGLSSEEAEAIDEMFGDS